MSHVSLSLLEQSLITGLLAGGLYGLLALGLSLSWGLLRLVNLGHRWTLSQQRGRVAV